MKEASEKPEEDLNVLPPIVEEGAVQAIGRYFYDPPGSETTLYRVPALNLAFGVTSLLLFAVTIWAIWQDHSRDWKDYNAEWRRHQEEQYQTEVSKEEQRLRAANLAEMEKALSALRTQLADDAEFRQAERAALKAENDANQAEIKAKFHKSELDSRRYYFEEARKHILDGPLKDTPRGLEELRALEEKFEREWVKEYEKLLRFAETELERAKDLRAEANAISKDRDELQKQIAALVRNRDLLLRNLRQVERSATNAIRNAPLLPPFAPTDQIQKVVLNDLTEPLNFLDVPRVDRCKTCHVNIDSPDPAHVDVTLPGSPHGGRLFRSHPRLDLFVGSASPHPYEQFGCTICHYGDGHSTSFLYAAHTPRDAAQKHEWEEKYHWHKPHHQDYPMLPLQYISSTCAKCHPNQDRVTGAERYNLGRDLVEEYGCFGCHKLQGFEKYRKVGPNLKQVAGKAGLDFLYRWIKDPPSFRPTTKMPRFFDLDNATGAFKVINRWGELEEIDFDRRNEVEALALATYIHGRSTPRPGSDLHRVEGRTGDPARGKSLVARVGCLGCHSIAREGLTHNDHAPDLSTIGSKARPEWLLDWIVQPRKHDPETRMPRLRLEADADGPQKLADIVAYLMTLRDPEFESLPIPEVNADRERILREIAFDYLRRGDTRVNAEKKVAAMGVSELLTYAGEKLVLRYGCFGCHAGISDEFDRAAPIGTELSFHGSKEVDKLDFAQWGHQRRGDYAIPKSRAAWYTAKLDNPRLFDLIPKEVLRSDGSYTYEPTPKVIQKSPEELLKMPLFSFRFASDPEGSSLDAVRRRQALRAERVDAAVAFLLSRLDDKIPLHKTKRLSADEQAVEDGRNLIRFLNCQGCHRIGVDPQELPIHELPSFSFEDPDPLRVIAEVEQETWLAESLKVGNLTIPAGTFIYDAMRDPLKPEDEEVYSVTQLAARQWEARRTPEADRRLKVYGFREGRMRRYVGDTPEARPMAAPILRNQGDRVNADWLFDFLLDIKPLRLQLELRMPSFHLTPEQAGTLVRWFKASAFGPYPRAYLRADGDEKRAHLDTVVRKWFRLPPEVPFPPRDLKPPEARALEQWLKGRGRPPYPHEAVPELAPTPGRLELARLGREIFQVTFPGDARAAIRLQCNTCHPAGEKLPSVEDKTSWGPDLGLARARLRPSWIGRWILDPKAHQPRTKMPDNFVSLDDPVQGIIVTRAGFDGEIEAIVEYLMHMQAADAAARAR